MKLETVRENTQLRLHDALELCIQGPKDLSSKAHFLSSYFYRRLAICELLIEARSDRFAAFLSKSAQARRHFLRLVAQGQNADPEFICASRNFPFVDALAAGQIELAVELARLSPDHQAQGAEYEDDFLLHRFLQRFTLSLCGREAFDFPAMLQRWQQVIGWTFDPYMRACQALLDRDVAELNEGLRDAIASRQKSFEEEKKQSVPQDRRLTEGYVFMNGLAFLRLAELQDMPVQREYRMIPKFARIPLGPPLPHDSWMHPEMGMPR
ncbi:hypothetical protein [Myxococcus sp. Y35]|uniref:hypothetical protein n=1 Tax=Pseudomyxococcus flavus TaxID=3115648 RepID=UPI003CEF900B